MSLKLLRSAPRLSLIPVRPSSPLSLLPSLARAFKPVLHLRPRPVPSPRLFHTSLSLSSPRRASPPTLNDHRPLDGTSYAVGPTTPPLDERTLGAFWDSLVATYPDSPALVSRHEAPDIHSFSYEGGKNEGDCLRWSYAEMADQVDALARGLLKMGLSKGDRVGAYLGNGSTYALLQWATAKIGCVLVCINPASRGPELLAALNLTGCKVLFIPPSLRKSAHIPILKSLLPTLSSSAPNGLRDPTCPELRSIVFVDNTGMGAKKFGEMLEREEVGGMDMRAIFEWEGKGVPGAEKCDNQDVVNIQFTSGTTGMPKGVGLTHRNLLNNGFLIGECMALRPPAPEEGWAGERLLNSPPTFHCLYADFKIFISKGGANSPHSGIVLGNLAFWTHGGCIVYSAEYFDPALTLRAVVLEKCTALHGVPTMYNAELALLDDLEQGREVPNLSDLGTLDFSHLRTGIAAGSPVPDETMRRLIKRMNLRDLTITYGQTESSPATIMSVTTDPVELRCKTVGRVLPHTHVRIVNPDHPLYPCPTTPSEPVGVPGELWSAGYAIQKGYWQNKAEDEKTMFTDANGVRWLMTGDQAVMDKDGYVSIVGRIKDIIIRGGENLHPVLIENRTLLLPGVADCSIIAVKDPIMGEVAGAFVQRENSELGRSLKGHQISDHIKAVLSHQSSPDWVWWLGEDGVHHEYPKTASGKIRKVELREWAKDLVERKVGRTRLP